MKRAMTLLAVGIATIACGDDPNRAPTQPVSPPVRPPTPTFVLFGTVRDEDGRPITGAIARLATPPYKGQAAISNAGGYFSFAGIAGPLTVTVYKDGYDRSMATVTLNADLALEFRLNPVEPSDSLLFGRTFQSSVVSGSIPCDPVRWDARAPCRRFDFTPPKTGLLTIVISWDGEQELDATIVSKNNQYVATSFENPGYQLILAAKVDANTTYEIRVNSYYSGQLFLLRADFSGDP